MLVADKLDFDVARLCDELLDEQPVVAKARLGLVLRGLNRLDELAFLMDDTKPLAATARGGLHHHRITNLGGDLPGMVGILDLTDIARDRVHLGHKRELLGFDLVAHRRDGFDVRADERHADLRQRFRKSLAFGEEAVARMHGFRAGVLAGLHDAVDDQIGLRRRRGADMDRLVRHFDMQRIAVGVGIDSHRLDAHAPRGLDDAACDFAAIGDQNFTEHAVPGK